MSREIEAKVYDTRSSTLVGVIVTDGVKVTSYNPEGEMDMDVLGVTSSFVHHYRTSTYKKANVGMPYPKILYEALVNANPVYGPYLIKTVTL